jgi:hypothetical protein
LEVVVRHRLVEHRKLAVSHIHTEVGRIVVKVEVDRTLVAVAAVEDSKMEFAPSIVAPSLVVDHSMGQH